MKLSFSTRAWSAYSWDEFIAAAKTVGYAGIELHGLIGTPWTEDCAPFCRASAGKTVRSLFDEGIRLACLDSVCDLSSGNAEEEQELLACIRLAHDFSIPYVRVRAFDASDRGFPPLTNVFYARCPTPRSATLRCSSKPSARFRIPRCCKNS